MPPMVVSATSQKPWFKSPLAGFQNSLRCSHGSLTPLTGDTKATDKEGVPLICTKAYLPQKQIRAFWPSKNYHHRPNDALRCHDSKVVAAKNADPSTDCYLTSDNCLPRIIKPRKRRKKDRKPSSPSTLPLSTTSVSALSLTSTDHCEPAAAEEDDSALSQPSNMLQGMRVALCSSQKSKSTSLIEPPSTPSLQDGDDQLSTTNAAKVFCNCKYCDPESDVWDIRQRCFSPNLMPPAALATASLAEPAATVIQHHVQKAATNSKNCATINLKRSSSEPTASKPFTSTVVTRVRSFNNTSTSNCDRGSQNLLVSSEIVTSHNGHRDIEIKFFSLANSSQV